MTRNELLVASNRGPISLVVGDDGDLQTRRGSGGLVSGLRAALSSSDGTWVCCALNDHERAVAAEAPSGHLREAGIDTDGLDVRMLPIDPTTFQRAYNGVANSTLWFVNHLLFNTPHRPLFDAAWQRQWSAYEKYNDSFAEALAAEAAAGATVMAQDYHLFLLPSQLRKRRPDLRIGHFTHTPWAPPEYFDILPDEVARTILTGLLGADHLGFHSRRWADAFLDCCRHILASDVDHDAGIVWHDKGVTHVGVHPLGADRGELRERASQHDVEEKLAHLRRLTGGRAIICRVDRTELQKNVIRGLLAYREFLHRYPEWLGRVVHIAFIYPSRQDLPEYREYTAAVQRIGQEIEDEFGTENWTPLILNMSNDYPGSLAALRMANVLLVNPIRDGMNLVVKEGLVLSESDCAVVLSRHAGAAEQLGNDAILVNPYDITQTADALEAALRMPQEERRTKAERMLSKAVELSPDEWFAQQLTAVRGASR